MSTVLSGRKYRSLTSWHLFARSYVRPAIGVIDIIQKALDGFDRQAADIANRGGPYVPVQVGADIRVGQATRSATESRLFDSSPVIVHATDGHRNAR